MSTPPARRFVTRLQGWSGSLPRFAVGAAWFFVLFSLAHLVWVVGVKWGSPGGLTTLYQTSVLTPDGPEVHRAWGLAYDGTAGLLLALAQGAAVVTAAALSTRPGRRPRRLGHGVLIGWSALWAVDLIQLAMIDARLDTMTAALIASLLFACTVYRAARRRRRPVGTEAIELPGAEALFAAVAPPPDSPAPRVSGPRRLLDRLRPALGHAARGARRAAEHARPLAARGAGSARTLATRGAAWLRRHGVLPETRPTSSKTI